jgi:hypothetical protein
MKTKYFLISNNDFSCYWSSDILKDIIIRYYKELSYKNRNNYDYKFNDFSIYRISYDPKRIEIDYGMDWYLYFLDKENDQLIDCDLLESYWIKQKEIKKDFLFHKNK